MESCHGKCRGICGIVIGVLMLLNYFVWPKWTGIDGWLVFFAIIIIIFGIFRAFRGESTCCDASAVAEKPKKRR